MRHSRQKAAGSTQSGNSGGSAHSLPTAYRLLPARSSGFTLAELLIVIALIVLMVAMAVPAFNFISGGRSVEGAQNQIAALLGRARAEAIGRQETRGVFFFLDPRTDRINMTIVRRVAGPDTSLGDPLNNPPTYCAKDVQTWLDLAEDAEFIPLPSGIGLQTIDDCEVDVTVNPHARHDDGYIGYNELATGNASTEPTRTLYGGVILFDGRGQLISTRYGFKTYYHPTPATRAATKMGDLLYRAPGVANPLAGDPVPANGVNDAVPRAIRFNPSGIYAPRSQFGFVLFDNEAFRSTNPQPSGTNYRIEYDWQFHGASGLTFNDPNELEQKEELWLDANSTPLLVNRYNGTLVKGE